MAIRFSTILFLFWLTFHHQADAQDAADLQFSGYAKNLQNWAFSADKNSLISGGFFHNRLIFNYQPDTTWTFNAQLRNRLFYGEWVRFQPGFADQLDTDNGWLDLSFVPINRASLVGSVAMDRLWAQWQHGRWKARIGRQRINWGMALTWNPNDWFNAMNFLDFDYEERPGTDALRLTWQQGDFSSLEMAVSPADSLTGWTGALRFAGNFREYDWQVLTGVWRNRLATGVGWAGNLGEMGFKGEASAFYPLASYLGDLRVSVTASLDRTLGDEWFVSGGFLFNSAGRSSAASLAELSRTNLAADNLMPGKVSLLTSGSYAVSPILTASCTVVYSPNGNLCIIVPSTAWSIAENWDLDLTTQLFWLDDSQGNWENLLNWIFFRTRWSF